MTASTPDPQGLPPLVSDGGADLGADEVARYSRHLIIPNLGTAGQKRLRNARVLVIGAGGLGSPTLLYLASAGVGTIGIVEFDVVEESNLQRQIIHGESDVGRPKAVSARESIAAINSGVSVVLHECRLSADNAVSIFAEYDLVIDGSDNFATRYLVNDAASIVGKPYVWGSIFRYDGQVSVFWEDAPDGRGVTYRDLYPDPPAPGTVPSCAEGGVLGVLCASIGSVMATEALKLLTGIGRPLLGRLMIYDALAATYRTVTLRRDPQRARVTELVDYEAFCGLSAAATDEGGADGAVTPTELAARIRAGDDIVTVDVREPVEWEINRLPGAVLIPRGQLLSGTGLAQLPQDRTVVLYCKTGVRSAEVLAALREAGLSRVLHLSGGIRAWGVEIDPAMPQY